MHNIFVTKGDIKLEQNLFITNFNTKLKLQLNYNIYLFIWHGYCTNDVFLYFTKTLPGYQEYENM